MSAPDSAAAIASAELVIPQIFTLTDIAARSIPPKRSNDNSPGEFQKDNGGQLCPRESSVHTRNTRTKRSELVAQNVGRPSGLPLIRFLIQYPLGAQWL